jgi:hypothetical protein
MNTVGNGVTLLTVVNVSDFIWHDSIFFFGIEAAKEQKNEYMVHRNFAPLT